MDPGLRLRYQGGADLVLVFVRVLLAELRQNGIQDLARPLHRLAVSETSNGGHAVVAPRVNEVPSGLDDQLLHEGHVDGDVGEAHRTPEGGGGDTHDLEGLPIENQRVADDKWRNA